MNDFDAMVKAGYPRVFNYALRLTLNRADAADITQDTFLRAYKARGNTCEDRNPDAWLFRIAFHCFLDARRRLKSQPDATSIEDFRSENGKFEPADSAADPEQALLSGQYSDAMTAALGKLSDQQRSLVHLAHVGELSHKELSQIFGCGPNTVKTRIHRARAILKRQLAAAGLDTAAGCRLAAV